MRISLIFGTRPETIKFAPVIRAFNALSGVQCHVCLTGQHREMLQQALDAFDLKADCDLKLMQANQSLAGLTARALTALDDYLEQCQPDLVLVQGDTTTVFAATLASFYRHIPVAHVEAGLRTGNLQAPWPEEANRVLTTRLASLHFAPTESARQNLLREGVPEGDIAVTGNTVVDALFLAIDKTRKFPPHIPGLPDFLQPAVRDESKPRQVLITGHRRENFGGGFEEICSAIRHLAVAFPDVHFIYPVHLNPNVLSPVRRILGGRDGTLRNVHLIEPLGYMPFVSIMDQASLILTDSGGVQEEAPSLGKPVLVMRDTTERPEGVEAGVVRLVGTNAERIQHEVSTLLTEPVAYEKMARAKNPYGDGKAAPRIVERCCAFLRRGKPASRS